MANLDDLYKEIILDHYKNPRNKGELETPPAIKSQGYNPFCGDEVTVYLDVEDDIIKDIKIESSGCSISQSSASMMTQAVKGSKIDEAEDKIYQFKAMMDLHEQNIDRDTDEEENNLLKKNNLGELEALKGVVKFPTRIKCATLPWNTLIEAIRQENDND